MDNLEQLIKIDWWQVILAIILFLVCLKFVWSLLDWLLFDKLGVETKKMKQQREDHRLLMQTVDDLKELHNTHKKDTEESIRHDEIIRNDLEKLTKIVIDSKIDDMRWEILDFTSALISGRKYNQESFNHVIKQYEKYEKILEENGMENGQVDASMEVVMDVYKEKLKNGFN